MLLVLAFWIKMILGDRFFLFEIIRMIRLSY